MRPNLLALVIAALLVPAFVAGADAPPAKTDTSRGDVQAFVKAYVDAQNRADVTTMMEMVSRKPGVTSISDGEITRGWDAIRTDSDQIVGKEGTYKISIGSIDVTPLGASYALAVAPFTLTMATPQGEVQVQSAMTLVLEKTGSKWLVIHEHASSKEQDDAGQGD